MEILIENEYYLAEADKKSLKKLGFRHHKGINGNEGDYYSLRFPLLKYLKSTTVEGEIIVDINDGSVRINAYNYGTNSYYPPFYQSWESKIYAQIIQDICSKFYDMFDKIGIKKINKLS